MVRKIAIGLSTACLVAASALAVPLDILNDPDHPLNQVQTLSENSGRSDHSISQAANAAVLYESGDTVTLFCDLATFKWGTFGGTDCWGWTGPDGTEYAMMGVFDGLRFVDATNLVEVDFVPGPPDGCGGARWRDIKTYQHYAYAVSECTGTNSGLMVIDLQYLPDSVHFIGAFPVSNLGHRTCHNISIDTLKGYLYAEGTSTANQSIHILSLANPASPAFVNSFGPANGIHDVYAMNDTAYLAEGNNPSFSIWNMANKLAPSLIVRVNVPSPGYIHNIWPNEDRTHVATTEETGNKTVKIWDISDLGNISLVGHYLAPSNLAHNAHIEDGTMYISHYESGVRVVDLTDPSSPTELAGFDTWSSDSPNFNGCWGVYPHTGNGLIYGSNMDGNLFILQRDEAVLADTMWVDTAEAIAGSQVRVDVYASNSLPLHKITIPVSYQGGYDLSLDSVSTVGLRTEYFEDQRYVGVDPINKRFAYTLTATLLNTSPDLDPGVGAVLSMYFSVPDTASGSPNPVGVTPYSTFSPTFSHRCIAYLPDTASGQISVVSSLCCVDSRGNANGDVLDKVNVSDLTYLVAYLFQSGSVPPCLEEANINGDPLESIAINDITYLVSFLFQSGPAPVSCP